MTAYIANNQKKNKLFNKRVYELEHAIKNEFSHEKIEKIAEKVREAKLSVYKSRFSEKSVLPASSWEPDELAKKWQAYTVDEIIHECKLKNISKNYI